MDNLKNILKQKDKQIWLIALSAFAGILVIIMYLMNYKTPKTTNDNKISIANIASGTAHSDLKTYFTKQINKKIVEQNDKVKSVEDIVKLNQDKLDEISNLKKQNEDLVEQLKFLNEKIDKAQSLQTQIELPPNYNPRRKADYDPNIIPAANNIGRNFNSDNYNQDVMQNSLNLNDEIEIVTVELDGENKDVAFKEIETYLPAGTHIRGIILGGVDAHTEVYGNNQTRVVTIRLSDNGDIPNGFKGKLKNCVLLASAWGNASSERVAMRGERLSCVGNTGKVLETDITATIYGPDGRQDVRGRVVYPEGKLLERAFLAGSLSGFGNGIAQSFTTQSISPLGATSVVQGADIFKQGAAAGVGKGLDKLSDYYIKRAEQLQPIIQVGSGTEVDVVIQKGFYLDGKSHAETVSNIPRTPFEDKDPKYEAKTAANMALANLKESMQ